MKQQLRIQLLVFCLLFPFLSGISLAGTSEALAELEGVQTFSFGGVGVAGTMSRGDRLFRELAAAPDRTALFHSLWDKGSNEAKCYALLGLYWLKDPAAGQFADDLVSKHISVSTIHGCIAGTKEEAATFVDSFRSGDHIKYYFPELAGTR